MLVEGKWLMSGCWEGVFLFSYVAVLCIVCCIALWLEISLEYVIFKKKVNLAKIHP